LYLAHPDARPFAVGDLGPDQIADYAGRRGLSLEEAARLIGPHAAAGHQPSL
jgi:5-methyltetrahydrofolate--homocysteine methyltransferase